ncbi:MAG: hypothetical protein PVI75_03010 [Gammaproteobacteria bacterium]|jgi:hypothetical protein
MKIYFIQEDGKLHVINKDNLKKPMKELTQQLCGTLNGLHNHFSNQISLKRLGFTQGILPSIHYIEDKKMLFYLCWKN